MKILRIRQFEKAFHHKVGERLQEERLRVGLSRQAVSNQTGIPVTMITQYERNSILPSDSRFDSLMRLYGLKGDDFLRSINIPNWDEVMGEAKHG
jgi:transcriptional regulator with XRE-family HTH domain